MKKLKLDFQHLGNAEILTRSQLKKIMGGDGGSGSGVGTRCVYYCCAGGGGGCGPGTVTMRSCSSNEDCQEAGQEYYSCGTGTYLAALCKG